MESDLKGHHCLTLDFTQWGSRLEVRRLTSYCSVYLCLLTVDSGLPWGCRCDVGRLPRHEDPGSQNPPNPLAGARLNPRFLVLLWIQVGAELNLELASTSVFWAACKGTPSFLPKSYLNSRCPRVGVAEGLRQLVMSTWAQFSYYGLLEFGQVLSCWLEKNILTVENTNHQKEKTKNSS